MICSVEWDPTRRIVEAITSEDYQKFKGVLAQLSKEAEEHNFNKDDIAIMADFILSDDLILFTLNEDGKHILEINGKQITSDIISAELSGNSRILSDESVSKAENLDDPTKQQEEKDQSLAFLKSFFKRDTMAKASYLQRVKLDFVNNFFKNKQGEQRHFVTNDSQFNNQIDNYKINQAKHILEYFSKNNLPFKKELLLLTKDEDILINLERIKKEAIKQFKKYDIFSNNKFFDLYRRTNLEEKDKLKLNAFNAYITLTHFDDIIDSLFDKIITINPETGKYHISFENSQERSWGNDETDPLSVIGNLDSFLFQTMPIYSLSGGIRQGQYLNKTIAASIRKLMWKLTYDDNIKLEFSVNGSFTGLKEKLFREFEGVFGKTYMTNFINEYNGKSLNYLLSQLNNDIRKLMPIATWLMLQEGMVPGNIMYIQEREYLKSLYENIFNFNNNDSFAYYSMHSESINGNQCMTNSSKDYYTYLCQFFSSLEANPTHELRYEKGELKVVDLEEKVGDQGTKRLQGYIEAVNQPGTKIDGVTIIHNFEDELKENESKQVSIYYTANAGSEKTYRITSLLKENKFILEEQVGNNFKKITKFSEDILNDLIPLFSQVTTLNYDKNLLSNFGNKGSHEITNLLLGLTSEILKNKTVNEYIISKGITDISKINNTIYDLFSGAEHKPKFQFDSAQIQVLRSNFFAALKELSLAKSLADGNIGTATLKDATGNSISSMTQSQLSTKAMQQIRGLAETDAASHFSLVKLLTDVSFFRNIRTNTGVIKGATKFNSTEFFINDFIYGFYGPKMKVMGPVLSDKPKLPHLGIDKEQEVMVNGVIKPFKNCTTDDIVWLIQSELGTYYQKIHDQVVADYNMLNYGIINQREEFLSFIQETNPDLAKQLASSPLPIFYPDNNFKSKFDDNGQILFVGFNDVFSDFKSADAYLHEAIAFAQKNGLKPNIIENLHGTMDKKGKLQANVLLYDCMSMYGRPMTEEMNQIHSEGQSWTSPDYLMSNGSLQMVVDLLQDDTQIRLPEKRQNIYQKTANGRNQGWIAQGGRIAYMKIQSTEGGKERKIAKREDFLQIPEYYSLIRLLDKGETFGESEEELKKLRIESATFDLSAVQQFLIKNGALIKKLELARNLIYSKAANQFLKKYYLKNKSRQEMLAYIQERYKNLSNVRKAEEDENTFKEKADAYGTKLSDEELVNKYIAYAGFDNNKVLDIYNDLRNDSNFAQKISEEEAKISDKIVFQITINPELVKFNLIDHLIGQEYTNITVGSYINHPAKGETISEMRAYAIGQQTKRNVSYVASKHQYERSGLSTVGKQINMMVITDLSQAAYNILGTTGKVKVHDGATIVHGSFQYIENWSLGNSAVGTDKKQFVHDYRGNSGTGIIVKTAGFAANNQRLRNSHELQRLNRAMSSVNWTDDIDITKGFHGEQLFTFDKTHPKVYSQVFFKRVDSDGIVRHYTISDVKYLGENTYTITTSQVAENGEIINGTEDHENQIIDNNYKAWELLFGGMWSEHIDPNTGLLTEINDDSSFINLALAMNNVGSIINPEGKIISLSDVKQPMKEALIAYACTAGAVKQGSANVNDVKTILNNDNYHVTYTTLSTADMGVQLDAEHESDGSHLSLMTQVVNALGARGYSADEADEVYKALFQLTRANLQDAFVGIENEIEGNRDVLLDHVTEIVIKSLKHTSDTDGNLLNTISEQIKDMGKSINYDAFKGKIPISHPAIYSKIASNVASLLTKQGIRIEFPGTMAVLTPSGGLYKIYAGKQLHEFNGHDAEILQQQFVASDYLTDSSQLRLERTYYVEYQDGRDPKTFLGNPGDYYALKELMDLGQVRVKEDVRYGRELGAYNAIFTDTEGNKYNIWDLAAIKDKWDDEESVRRGLPQDIERKRQLQREVQKALNAIGSGKEDTVDVYTKEITKDGIKIVKKKIRIDKGATQIEPYELIVNKMFMTAFGLKPGDDLSAIKDDELFFMKRQLENYQSKIQDSSLYDIELKTINGEHVYLLYDDGEALMPEGLEKVDLSNRTKIIKNEVWFFDSKGKKLFMIPSRKGKGKRSLEIDGNVYFEPNSKRYIIQSSNISELVDQFKFTTIHLTNRCNAYSDESKEKFIKSLKKSSKRSIKRMLENLGDNFDRLEELNRNEVDALEFLKNIKSKEEITPEMMKLALVRNMIQNGLETHTSFLKSLKVIGSRTPAQSHQSFMPMIIVGFDTSLANSAYVSRWQLWLQGSDYDIDKVNLLANVFKSGRLVKWSNLMSLESTKLLDASEELPFPTEQEVKFAENGTSVKDYLSGHISIAELNLIEKSIYEDGISEDDKAAAIRKFAKIIRFINRFEYIAESDKQDELTLKVINLINTHNDSLKGKSTFEKQDAIKNFIGTYMFKISSDPVNQIQAQSPIDDITDFIKKEANKRLLAQKAKRFDGTSVTSKINQLCLTLAGKENVGIVASSMKVLECMGQYYNIVLNHGSETDQGRLLFAKQIGEEVFNLIANTYSTNIDNVNLEDLKIALDNIDTIEDAFIWMSGLLSLATDNAKDPTLSKINAGPDMIGLYTAGLTLGIPFETLVKLIDSETGRIMSQLQRSNVFDEGKDNTNRIPQIIKYIRMGPAQNIPPAVEKLIRQLPKDLFNRDLSKEKSLIGLFSNEYIGKTLVESLRRLGRSFNERPNSEQYEGLSSKEIEELELNKKEVETRHRLVQMLIREKNRYEYRDFEQIASRKQEDIDNLKSEYENKPLESSKKKIDKLESELIQLKNVHETIVKRVNDIEIALDGGNLSDDILERLEILDFTKLKSSVGAKFDQQGKQVDGVTKREIDDFCDSILQWYDIRDAVNEDYSLDKSGQLIWYVDDKGRNRKRTKLNDIEELSKFSEEMAIARDILKLNQGLPNSSAEQLAWLRKFEQIIQKRANNNSTNENLQRLKELNDHFAKLGKTICHDFELDLKLFVFNEEYRKAAIEAYEHVKDCVNVLDMIWKVNHYRGYLTTMATNIEEQNTISVVFRKTNEYSKRIVKERWNISDSATIENLNKAISKYITYKLNQSFLKSQQIKLRIQGLAYDSSGNLQENLNGASTLIDLSTESGRETFKLWVEQTIVPRLKNDYTTNQFVQRLTFNKYSYNPRHNTTRNLSPGIETMPKTEQEVMLFRECKQGLNSLLNIVDNNTGISYADIMFLYNLIAYQNKSENQSFSGLFEDIMADESSNLVNQYKEFISLLDTESDLYDSEIFFEDLSELERFIAPSFNAGALYGAAESKIPVIWVQNPATLEYELYRKKSEPSYDNPEEVDDSPGYDDMDIDFDEIDSGEEIAEGDLFGQVQNEKWNQFVKIKTKFEKVDVPNFGQSLSFTDKTRFYLKNPKVSLNDTVNISEIIIDGRTYQTDEFLRIAKQNGYDINNINDVVAMKIVRIFNPETNKYETHEIIDTTITERRLRTLLNKKPEC